MDSQPDSVVLHGDSLDVLAGMPECSVDAVVCDPPYGLADLPAAKIVDALTRWLAGDRAWVPDGAGFMGKGWDRFVPPPALWDQVYRVLKPGGHLLAFAGARTHDLMGMSIRLAGFDTRDSIVWHHGSGMPHGLDVSKAIDDRLGHTRQVTPTGPPQKRMISGADQNRTGSWLKDNGRTFQPGVSEPVSVEAARWAGWNTALKPASEPIVVARKPFAGTVADNVLAHGVGALNIDGCRIAPSGPRPGRVGLGTDTPGKTVYGPGSHGGGSVAVEDTMLGRWPANVVLTHSAGCRNVGVRQVQTNTHHPGARPAGKDGWGHTGQTGLADIQVRSEQVDDWVCADDCPVRALDVQSGDTGAQGDVPAGISRQHRGIYGEMGSTVERPARGDSGGASRFFHTSQWEPADLDVAFMYHPKATGKERPDVDGVRHVSVKPLGLMRWLCRLAVPAGGVVLDPFAGSGTTVEAALLEGFRPVAVEGNADYLPLIDYRVARWRNAADRGIDPEHDRYFDDWLRQVRPPEPVVDESQLDLFTPI